jgi:circadian clock protein KaiC
MTFLVRGVEDFGEPGVFMSFEERAEDLVENVASLGFCLDRLVAEEKIALDHVSIERSEIEETGEYDLEGLFIRLGYAIDSVGAKRVVLDTIEALFSGLSNAAVLRSELKRLFDWLKARGVTAIVTAERGEGQLTRHGLEEYVSDCVILLDHRVQDQLSTRRLRVVKYRGSAHGANEYPFLIDDHGISVLPITSLGLDHAATDQRVSTGVGDIDAMLSGGFFRGSTVLISGMAGSGKSSLAAHFAKATAASGERCLYFAFEESPSQIARNMRSIGLHIEPLVEKGLLRFSASRPSLHGLEMHLAVMHREIDQFKPASVIVDPVSSLMGSGLSGDVHAMLLRLIDFLKTRGVTALFTSLTHGLQERGVSEAQVSSLMDTWLLLYNRESNGEHNREIYIMKSRGSAHSNQLREFLMSDDGIKLRPAYVGPAGVLTGSARLAQEARERAEELVRREESERRARQSAVRRAKLEAQIAALQAELATEAEEAGRAIEQARSRDDRLQGDRQDMEALRSARRQRGPRT